MLFLFLILSFLYSGIDSVKKYEKLPPIDWNKGGLVFESDIKLEEFLKKNKTKEVLSNDQIEQIKNNAKNFQNDEVYVDDIVIIETTHGTMKFKLFSDIAPNNCRNFKKLANSTFYDETLFHRIIPDFILQGGDILTRDAEDENDGTGNPGWTIDAEFSNLKHKKGTLSMHRIKNDINSAGSQFFITLSRQKKLDNNYTIIGEIIEGLTVLDMISNVPSESKIAFRLLRNKIPKNSKSDNWHQIIYRDNEYFIEIPTHVNKESFKKMILNRLENNTTPSVPIKVKKIRVTNNKIDNK